MHARSKASLSAGIALVLLLHVSVRPCRASERDPWWGQDKALHFSASAMLASDGYAGASLLTSSEIARAGAGTLLSFFAGVSKEVYDRYTDGDPSLRDLTWDVVGAATGATISWLVDRFLF